MNRMTKLVTIAALVGGAAWAGVALNQKLKCDGLEEDFLNAFSSIKSSTALQSVAERDPKLAETADELTDIARKRMNVLIVELTNQCGSRAAQTAIRKSAETLN